MRVSPRVASGWRCAADKSHSFMSQRTPAVYCTYSRCMCVCVYLCPLVGQRVVGLHSVEVDLPVVPAHSVEAVTEETDADRVSADAHGSDGRPHVCLRVVPAHVNNEYMYIYIYMYKTHTLKADYSICCCLLILLSYVVDVNLPKGLKVEISR